MSKSNVIVSFAVSCSSSADMAVNDPAADPPWTDNGAPSQKDSDGSVDTGTVRGNLF